MANLYIMCGLAFSGKSTLSRKITDHLGARRIAFDELWIEKEKEGVILQEDEGWKYIRKVGLDEIAKTLDEGISVVYDDNNPKFEHREEVRKIAKKVGAKDLVIYLNTPMETIQARENINKNTGERHEVETVNFQKVTKDLEVPTSNEKFVEFTPETNIQTFLQNIEII